MRNPLARGLVTALALLTLVGCKPLDDAMVAVSDTPPMDLT